MTGQAAGMAGGRGKRREARCVTGPGSAAAVRGKGRELKQQGDRGKPLNSLNGHDGKRSR